jgi:hypothetical protein
LAWAKWWTLDGAAKWIAGGAILCWIGWKVHLLFELGNLAWCLCLPTRFWACFISYCSWRIF